jgi:outer membrane receptor for ferrienterochelin and colicin
MRKGIAMRITGLILVTGLLFSVSADDTEKNSNGSTIVKLKKMVITASRRVNLVENTPDVSVVINKDEIEAINPQEVSDILEYMSGVSIEGGTGGGLPFKKTVNINGMPVLYSIIMVDGVRVKSSHIHTGTNVNVVPPESIERIELIKGAASAQYGSDALGGVLNIITKDSANNTSLDFSGYYGSNNTMHTGLNVSGPVNSQVSYKVFGAWEKSDGPAVLEPASRHNKLFYEKFNFLSRIYVDINEKTTTYVSLDYLNSEAPFGSDTAEAWLFTPKIGLDVNLSEKIDAKSIVYYTQWKNQKNNELNEKFEPVVTLGFKGIPKNYLLCGIEGSYNNFMRKRVAEHSQYRAGLFIQDEFTPVTKLTFLGALRFDGIEGVEDNDNLFVFSPKISLLISPHDMFKNPVRAWILPGGK